MSLEHCCFNLASFDLDNATRQKSCYHRAFTSTAGDVKTMFSVRAATRSATVAEERFKANDLCFAT